MAVKRILVVEDDKVTLKIEQEHLRSAGFEVDAVESAQEALENLEKEQYVLVVSDVMMPNMDGFELFKEIRRRFTWKNIPVLLVTSLDGAMTKAIEAGVNANAVLKKPFTKQSLLTAVKMLVGDPSPRTSLTTVPPSQRASLTSIPPSLRASLHPVSSSPPLKNTPSGIAPYWDDSMWLPSTIPSPPQADLETGTDPNQQMVPQPRPSKLPALDRPAKKRDDKGASKKKKISWLKKLISK